MCDSPLPFVEELPSAPYPWAVARRFADQPGLIFFDSADRSSAFARYSYVAAAPRQWHSFRVGDSRDPWADMVRMLGPQRAARPDLPPFQGGIAGLFAYELGQTIERLPAAEFDEFRMPDLAVGIYDWVISFDHAQNRAWLVSHCDSKANDAVRDRLRDGGNRTSVPRVFNAVTPSIRRPLTGHEDVFSNFTRAEYEAAVRRAVDFIHAGDCFQVNLSQRLLAPFGECSLDLYGRLRACNAAPFAAYFDLGEFQILSASPERFLSLTADGVVTTRPIKGTRRRGQSPEEDFALQDDLRASAKDRAENVMIVDLLRNDLSRVCEISSVVVSALCQLESHPTVHHLVSEVRGRLRRELGPVQLLRAAFPGGSVTGAPKVRAMHIITELERVARGAYCGCLGWIGFDGAMETSILIRTMTAGRGWLQFPAGGGIVADSDPAHEYEETLHKVAGLLRALER